MKIIASAVPIVSYFCWAVGSLDYKYNHSCGSLFYTIGLQLIDGMIACFFIGVVTSEWIGFNPGQVSIKT